MFKEGDRVRALPSGLIGKVACIMEWNGRERYWVVFNVDEYNAWYIEEQLELVKEE